MLATMGYIVPEYFRFPGVKYKRISYDFIRIGSTRRGYCSPSDGVKFADVPNGLAALGKVVSVRLTVAFSAKVPAAGWTQIFLFLGLVEKGLYTYDPTRQPGDYKNAGTEREASSLRCRCAGRAEWQHDDSWRRSQSKAELGAGQWTPCHDGDHRHVLSGRPHRLRLGRLGPVHRLAAQGRGPLKARQRTELNF